MTIGLVRNIPTHGISVSGPLTAVKSLLTVVKRPLSSMSSLLMKSLQIISWTHVAERCVGHYSKYFAFYFAK